MAAKNTEAGNAANTYAAFDTAYGSLNTEQKKAVDLIEGPVFVIAGPGTGKTQVLTLRIANILRTTDTPPESILALTFTDAAAREMRARLTRIIGSRAASVRITTFHGFAESLVNRFPEHFPRIIGSVVATPAERAELLEKVLLAAPVKHLRPWGDQLFYHYATGRALSTLKRENVTSDALELRLKEEWQAFENLEGKVHEKGKYLGQMKAVYAATQKRIERTEDLLAVYRAYEAALAEAKRYDFDDLILEAVRALTEDDALRLQAQESLLYILADEHQDANRAQNALLALLSGFHDRPNLFIVGDEKQAIYRFQGADLDTMQHFRTSYPGTAIFTLVENYRSTQTILDTALSLITSSPDERLSRVPLLANAPHARDAGNPARPISLTSCSTEGEEVDVLAARIRALIESGTPAEEIAILVRRNGDVMSMLTGLSARGVPVAGAAESNALKNRFVEALVRMLHAVSDPSDEQLHGVLLLPGFALSVADVARITRFAREQKRSVLSVLGDEAALTNCGLKNTAPAIVLYRAFERLVHLAAVERPATVAERALQDSGLLRLILAAPDRTASLGAIRALITSFESLSEREHGAQLPRALSVLALHEERGIPLRDSGGDALPGRVQIMTVHKAKGREFSQVFIPMLTTRAWSTRARGEYFELPDILSGATELEDERRLLYVAITRAKVHATLSYALAGNDGRAQEPSTLIAELAPELLQSEPPREEEISIDVFATRLENTSAGDRERAVLAGSLPRPTADDCKALRDTFLAQGLSPTALNNYLECPWKYFYVNLLRIPEAKNRSMLYGTAIHAALKRYGDQRAKDIEPSAEQLVSWFIHAVERLPLTEVELSDLRAKGERSLAAWWKERSSAWPQGARGEVSQEASLVLDSEGTELLLRGNLDRIDPATGTSVGVDVIDYKTGKPKSRNELMGTTKNADGNYFRQLTFYKLLLERGAQPQAMREGVIEFVEPDEKGRIRTERFEVSETDVEQLIACMQETAHDILTLSFWDEPCDEDDCRWCHLRFGLTA